MKKRIMLVAILGILALTLAGPAFAQEEGVAAAGGNLGKVQLFKWSIIAGAFSLGFAAAICALSQGISVSAACNGIARNPGASPQIRFSLIFGLVLIESLAIYVLLINLIIFFVKWDAYPGI
ncbi:MAG: ATP synthase F0 subunit C [Acidobacteriota bacterium]